MRAKDGIETTFTWKLRIQSMEKSRGNYKKRVEKKKEATNKYKIQQMTGRFFQRITNMTQKDLDN